MSFPVQILSRTTVGEGDVFERPDVLSEVELSVSGTGAVSATFAVHVSVSDPEITTPARWISLGDVVLSGTDLKVDTDAIERAYHFIKVELKAISGTDAVATAVMSNM